MKVNNNIIYFVTYSTAAVNTRILGQESRYFWELLAGF